MKPPPGFEKRELAQPAVTPDASPSASVAPKIASTASTAQKSSDDAKVSRRPLPPKRQLWIVRVPKPPSEELHPEATSNDGTVSVDEQITTAEAEIARLDGVIRESNDARDSSRAHLAKARDRAREVSDQIRAQLATCKPAQDRLHEIESMDRKIRDAVRSIGGYESV
jgi:septal ring factor EnvC (AmiA/AmiB activator)